MEQVAKLLAFFAASWLGVGRAQIDLAILEIEGEVSLEGTLVRLEMNPSRRAVFPR